MTALTYGIWNGNQSNTLHIFNHQLHCKQYFQSISATTLPRVTQSAWFNRESQICRRRCSMTLCALCASMECKFKSVVPIRCSSCGSWCWVSWSILLGVGAVRALWLSMESMKSLNRWKVTSNESMICEMVSFCFVSLWHSIFVDLYSLKMSFKISLALNLLSIWFLVLFPMFPVRRRLSCFDDDVLFVLTLFEVVDFTDFLFAVFLFIFVADTTFDVLSFFILVIFGVDLMEFRCEFLIEFLLDGLTVLIRDDLYEKRGVVVCLALKSRVFPINLSSTTTAGPFWVRRSAKMVHISNAIFGEMPWFWVRSKWSILLFRFSILMTSMTAHFVIPFALKSIHKIPASSSSWISALVNTLSPSLDNLFCDKSSALNPVRIELRWFELLILFPLNFRCHSIELRWFECAAIKRPMLWAQSAVNPQWERLNRFNSLRLRDRHKTTAFSSCNGILCRERLRRLGILETESLRICQCRLLSIWMPRISMLSNLAVTVPW